MPALRTRDTHSRSLEVTTDVPPPPTLAIISPTPRAFTFPISHNLTDSPYSSPSTSPFEADRQSLVLTCNTTPPPTSIVRTSSPTPSTSLVSASPPPSSHKRRKSSCSSDIVERRPKKGDEDYIKRPENAFILFRRKCCEERQQAQEEAAADGPTKKQRQADLSKTISQQWKSLSPEERQYWEQLAKEKKKEHEQMYPNYVYRPQRSKDKDGRSKNRKLKGKRGEETDTESVSFVVPMAAPRHHGRSASAPTPPPYQSIQIPNVYMTPSCPTSPSLLPMISRRASHPGHSEEAISPFDFMPKDTLMAPPPFGQTAHFEANLQSSGYLRGMFNMSTQSAPGMLLPAQQIVSSSSSIGSGSSGPPSPLTPTTAMLSHSFSQLNASSEAPQFLQPHPNNASAELNTHMQLQPDIDLSAYSWEGNSMWSSDPAMLLGDDFDLGAIPPIELGLPKFMDDMSNLGGAPSGAMIPEYSQEYSQEYQQAYNQGLMVPQYPDAGQNMDGLVGFEEMLAGHGF